MSEKCGCGCGHDHEHEEDVMDLETMFLTLDDDTEMECGILGVFEVEGLEGKEYIALLPLEDETVLLYEYKEVGDEIELNVIEDDDEFDQSFQRFLRHVRRRRISKNITRGRAWKNDASAFLCLKNILPEYGV